MKKIIYTILIILTATALAIVWHYKIFWIAFYAAIAATLAITLVGWVAFKIADVRIKNKIIIE